MPPGPSRSNLNGKSKSPVAPLTSSTNSAAKKRKASELTSIQTTLNENGDEDMGLAPTRTPAISPEAEFAGALNAINPLTGQPVSVQNQNGTWFGDTLAEKLQSTMEQPSAVFDEGHRIKRPCASSEGSSNIIDFAPGTPSTEPPNPGFHLPHVGKYSLLLSIGWTKRGIAPDVLAATQGYCRYIEKHYPLTNVDFCLEHKGKELYLIKSDEGYLLFKDDLTEGKLVSRDFQATLARLQSPPVQFDGQPMHPTVKDVEMDVDG